MTTTTYEPAVAGQQQASGGQRADSRTQLVLAVAALVMGLGQTTLFTFLPLLMEQTGLSLARITTAFAVGSGLFLIGAPLWSRASDRLGRRPVVVVALLGFALSHGLLLWQLTLGSAWAGQEAMLMLGRVIYGLTVSGLVPTCQAWLLDLSGSERRLGVLSRFSAGLTLGRLLGPALAAASLWLSPQGPLWLVALAAWPALLLLPLAAMAPRSDKAQQAVVLDKRNLALWLGLALAMQIALGQVQYTLGPWLALRFELTPLAASSQLGWVLTGGALWVMVLQLGVVPRCQAGRGLLLTGGAAILLSGLLFALGQSPWLAWLGFAALGSAASLLVPTYTTLATQAAGAAGQSRVAGLIAAAHTVGFSLAAALAGALFGVLPAAPFWLVAVLGLVVLLMAANVPARATD
ncbi:MFS transporter [Chitinimonas sp.]|uniref:MFS transporter n=1 Tax=Chitinimonas sp. TaxID=1934313 RepID=UPI002F938756